MNILVIGGNGFIGSHLVDLLLLNKHNVRVFDTVYERFRQPLPDVDYRISTLENIPDLYESLLGIDMVFHLACSSVPSTSNIDTVSDVEKNLLPTLNILNLSVKLGVKRIIFFSSGGAIYGIPTTLMINEEHIVQPISSYGIVKAAIENYLFLYQRLYNIKPLIIRPSNPYGPRQGHFMAQGVISTFLKKIKAKESIAVFGDGKSTKDYIYITDLIDRCYKLSFSDEVGAFNIGSGQGTSINRIIELITKVIGREPEVIYSDARSYDVQDFILDSSKASNIIGRFPLITMEQGISETWNWINSIS